MRTDCSARFRGANPAGNKAFSLSTRVSQSVSALQIRDFRERVSSMIGSFQDRDPSAMYVMLNGDLIGTTLCPDNLVDSIRSMIGASLASQWESP